MSYFGAENAGKYEPVAYQGIADFLARNPDCCTFTPLGKDDFTPTPEWSERNDFYGFVRAKFQAYWTDKSGERTPESTILMVAVTTCGTTIWYDADDDSW